MCAYIHILYSAHTNETIVNVRLQITNKLKDYNIQSIYYYLYAHILYKVFILNK